MKAFFFSTVHGDFSFDASKEKWGCNPAGVPAFLRADTGASSPGDGRKPALFSASLRGTRKAALFIAFPRRKRRKPQRRR